MPAGKLRKLTVRNLNRNLRRVRAYIRAVAVNRARRSGDTDSGYANARTKEKERGRMGEREREMEIDRYVTERGGDVTVTVTILAYRSGTGGR